MKLGPFTIIASCFHNYTRTAVMILRRLSPNYMTCILYTRCSKMDHFMSNQHKSNSIFTLPSHNLMKFCNKFVFMQIKKNTKYLIHYNEFQNYSLVKLQKLINNAHIQDILNLKLYVTQ